MEGHQKVGKLLISGVTFILSLAILLAVSGSVSAAPQLNLLCSDCHGMPPLDSAIRDKNTGAFQGNHQTHQPVNAQPANCTICHNSAGFTTSHENGQISFLANINNSPATSGSQYMVSGAQVLFKNQTSIPVLGTCYNVNCHFETVSPQWGTANFNSTAGCSACHAAPGSSTPHSAHDLYYSFANNGCVKCHPDYVTGLKFSHATSAGRRGIKVTLAEGLYSGSGNNYLPSQSGSRVLGSCSNLYCHSAGQADSAKKVAGALYRSPKWGTGGLDCGGCHNNMATFANASSGSHKIHAQVAGYNCNVCHGASYGTATVPRSANSTHVNKKIDLAFIDAGLNTAYSKYSTAGFAPGKGYYGRCSNGNCHGPANILWGADTSKPECEKCHGNRNTPWNALSGATATTDAKAGAHFIHISSSGTVKYMRSLQCSECHTAVTSVAQASHLNNEGAAKVQFGALASSGTGTTPSYSSATGTCSNVYCHGGRSGATDGSPATKVAAPTWTQDTLLTGTSADCGKCHGNPPNTTGHNGVTANQCNACHNHVNNTAPYFTSAANLAKHINGVLDGGVSNGGQLCYSCHGYQAMSNGTTTYHHVLGGAQAADQAPNTGAYPTSTTEVYCVSCHSDHNYFNSPANKAANLRTGITAAGSSVTNSDYSSTSPFGICISCHTNALKKDMTNQRAFGAYSTPVITGATYGAVGSMHNYTTSSLFGSNTFLANCSKCHTDNQTKDKQTSADKFGTHWSAQRSILNTLGITAPTETLGADFCYRCHSKTTDTNPGGGPAKLVANKDYFGSRTMDTASQDTFTAMQLGAAGLPGGQPTASTNTLYLKSSTNETPAEPMSNAFILTSGTYSGTTTYLGRAMSPYAGATGESRAQTTVTTANRYYRIGQFISPPVSAAASFTTAQSFTLNFSSQESSTSINGYLRYALWVWNANDTQGTNLRSVAQYGTEIGGNSTTKTMQAITFTPSSNFTLNAGDKLLLEVEFINTGTTSGTLTAYWGSATDSSNLTLPSNVTFTYTSQATPASGRHDVAAYEGIHRWDETKGALQATKHVDCNDCHDPHEARQGTHTLGSATMSPALQGATGVTVTTWGANWTGVTTWGQTTAQKFPNATAEWQICFKCHSASNANYASWGGAGAQAWTDLGLEFNPNNESYHPVIQALPSTGNRRLASTALTGGWTPGLVMTCSDCHGADTGASKGPHGASVKWMLNPNTTGTKYYNWPYTTAAGNGTSTGTLLTGTGSTTVPTSNFCFSCHVWSGGGAAHTQQGSSHGRTCVGCHIRVPHGGKALRLLTGPNAPARYKPDGNGGGTTYMNGGTRPASGTMGESNCTTAGGCTQHNAANPITW